MRGVIYANLTISSSGSDKHSGVDGGIVDEPMGDMIRVLGQLGSGEDVRIPGFCECPFFRFRLYGFPSSTIPLDLGLGFGHH
jgi:hypothetical protein